MDVRHRGSTYLELKMLKGACESARSTVLDAPAEKGRLNNTVLMLTIVSKVHFAVLSIAFV